MNIDKLFEKFWNDYIEITPIAKVVHTLLQDRGENIINDHIAFRTFKSKGIGILDFATFFKNYGYSIKGEYNFELKKLNAIHLENEKNSKLPKIFISELRYEELDEKSTSLIERELSSIANTPLENLLLDNKAFNISTDEYQHLQGQSEYAAWLCAHGFRANHFTVLVNELKSLSRLEDLNELLLEKEVSMNVSGGIIKGSSSVYLEQSSTMASQYSIKFTDGELSIPTCYYEFALRYNMPSGELYQGFVTDSADKIFESTDHELD